MTLDKFVLVFNTGTMFIIAAIALWFVLDSRFKTRIWLTIGLSLVCIGALSIGWWSLGGVIPEEYPDIERGMALLNVGFVIVIVAMYRRLFCAPKRFGRQRRSSDFVDLDERHHGNVVGGRKS